MNGSSPTIAERILVTGGRSTGFDYLRVMLSVSVVCWHSIIVCYGTAYQQQVWQTPIVRAVAGLILPIFFGLSGFLVAGSFERSRTIIQFVCLRVIRIFPALTAEILLSALILGPCLTTYSMHEYFSDHLFRSYFMNALGVIHYMLPGLFVDNPNPSTVNGQLWTIPYELKCYEAFTLLALTRLVKLRYVFVIIVIIYHIKLITPQILHHETFFTSSVRGEQLVLAFLYSALIYAFRDRIRWNFIIFTICTLITMVELVVPFGDYILAPTAAYMSVYIGLTNLQRNLLLRFGDLSYGIFLYGYPIQQFVAYLGIREIAPSLFLALPLTIAFAFFSWNVVERPALALRKHLIHLDFVMLKISNFLLRLVGIARDNAKSRKA